MAWALGTWVANAIPPQGNTLNDYPFYVKTWEENWNTPLGSNLWPFLVPAPAARCSLDDECSYEGFSEVAQGPAVAGGRRNRVIARAKLFAVVLGIDYQQRGPYIFESRVDPPATRPPQNELLPVLMRTWLKNRTYRLATVQEGLQKMHPSFYPITAYNDDRCRILEEVQRHFLEPVIDGGVSWQLWETSEVNEVFKLRLQRFLVESEFFRKEIQGVGGSIELPQDFLRTKRVQWEYTDLRKKPRALTRIDEKVADQGYPGWERTTSEPTSFIEEPYPLALDITAVPPPDDDGHIGVRYVPTQDLVGTCPKVGVPRMFTWALKWGVIADLLKKEGEANDPVRSKAAEELYGLGVKLARALLGDQNGTS